MAVGRLSDFTRTTTARPRGEVSAAPGADVARAPGLAGLGPLAPDDFASSTQGAGFVPAAPPSPVTGMTPQANAMVGRGVNLFSGLPSLGGLATGLLTGAAGLRGLPGLAINTLGGEALGRAGRGLGIPTSLGDLVTMALNAMMNTGNFPLALNPAASPATTLSETGLNPAQLSGLMQGFPTPFGFATDPLSGLPEVPAETLGDITFGNLFGGEISDPSALGFGLGPGPTGASLGFTAANPLGSGHVAGGPVGGNAMPESINFFGVRPSSPIGFGSVPSPDVSFAADPATVAGFGFGGGIGQGDAPSGAVSGSGAEGGGLGDAGIGAGGVGPGEGSAGGTGGAGTGEGEGGAAPGDSGVFHRGGFVGLDLGGRNKSYGMQSRENYGREVPARLEPGEYVVNKEAASPFRNILNKMNEMGRAMGRASDARPDWDRWVPDTSTIIDIIKELAR